MIFSGGKEIKDRSLQGLFWGKNSGLLRVMPIVVHNIALDVQ